MRTQKVLYLGAEAEIRRTKYLGFQAVEKRRIRKLYRIKEIDALLILSRTKEEAKLMMEARMLGVSIPVIYDVDVMNGIITMEFLKGKRIKDILHQMNEEGRKQLCEKIGESIALLHNNDIIHGDITTSNMILLDEKVHFIDFGLGGKNSEIEAKGVDLHVLMEAFSSTHSRYPRCFDYVVEGYRKSYKGDAILVCEKIDEIVRRGRYRT